MREGALPSPSNQARVIEETLALAKRENYRVNVIEAFDQPWKRCSKARREATGASLTAPTGGPKFTLGGAVSDHPHWLWQALIGIALAALTFGGAWFARGDKNPLPRFWLRIAVPAFLSSIMFGWTVELIPIQSYSIGGWLRSIALGAVAAVAPILCAAAIAAGRSVPPFTALLGRRGEPRDLFGVALAGVFLVLVVLAVEESLGLVFDPRYRDFVFAPLGAAVIPFLVLMLSTPRPGGPRAVAETAAAALLAACAVYILPNESLANRQSVWFCAAILGLALILARVRDVPNSE